MEQDYLRRIVLKEKEIDDGTNIALVTQVVEFALAHNYDVVLDGMLKLHRYDYMLKPLIKKCPNNYVFYYDVSLGETLKRHASKPIADEVSEADLKSWFKPNDITGFKNEIIIPESYSVEQTTELIKKIAEL